MAVVMAADRQTCCKHVKGSWASDKPANSEIVNKTKINIGSLFANQRLMSKVNAWDWVLGVSAVGYFHFCYLAPHHNAFSTVLMLNKNLPKLMFLINPLDLGDLNK